MGSSKILVVEDDLNLQDVLKYNLAKEGYDVLTASDGIEALDVARSKKPDLIVLDVMLPRMDGLEVCRILRREMTVPILMLTAKAEETDKVVGLELGADDYMTKPFSIREFLARIRAMLRRSEMMAAASSTQEAIPSAIKVGELEIDLAGHTVSRSGTLVDLSHKEFDLLAFLVKNKGQVFSREQLLEKVWGYDFAGDTRTVDVHIRWLRQKIEIDPASPAHLLTVRGIFYKFDG
jgi:two-component system OmpR family response regulator